VRGGKRPGAGRPKGSKSSQTLDKLAAREFVRQRVTAAMQPMLDAQIAHARGIGHVFTRDKAGKFTRIENIEHIDRLLTEGSEGTDFWIFAKDPSTQAFTDLLNRALDKPAEQEQAVSLSGTLKLVWDE
jgi:hypothetical protein